MAGGAETSNIAAPPAIARQRRADAGSPEQVAIAEKSYFALNGAMDRCGIRP
jgi:hypothetical protein